jgi:hypothetical protein
MRNRTVNGTGALRPHAFAPIQSERDSVKSLDLAHVCARCDGPAKNIGCAAL